MSKNLYLDPITYDLTIENFNLKFTSSWTEWLSQKIENKLKTYQGEFFANSEIGVPYHQSILGKGSDLVEVNSIFKNEILSISVVKEIIDFTVDYDTTNRIYNIEYKIRFEIPTGGDGLAIGSLAI